MEGNSTMNDQSSTIVSQAPMGTRSKDSPWYDKEIEELQPAARELLEKYAGVPSQDVLPHIYKLVRQ